MNAPIKVILVGRPTLVSFSVANKGKAIPEQFMEEMFEPLARGQRAAKDASSADTCLGLGLYISREIVRAHKVSIAVPSDEHKTMFSVELPRQNQSRRSVCRATGSVAIAW